MEASVASDSESLSFDEEAAKFWPFRAFSEKQNDALQKMILAEQTARHVRPFSSSLKEADIKRFNVFKTELLDLARVGRRSANRHTRGMWTPAEDKFCLKAVKIRGKGAAILAKYNELFPRSSTKPNYEQLRSRGRVLQAQYSKANTTKRKADPKRNGPLRMFGRNHLNLVMDMLQSEEIARLDTGFRAPTNRELALSLSLLAVLPTFFRRDLRDETGFDDAPVTSSDDESSIEYEYKRLKRNSYSDAHDDFIANAVIRMTTNISWSKIREEWDSAFPGDGRTNVQLRERYAHLLKRSLTATTAQPKALTAELEDEPLGGEA